jgi:EAL domain-containing protein (putative c-di-GMP-specific phosphodiesterase class I)
VSEVAAQAQPLSVMREVTKHLWLLEALAHRPIEPYFQPVVNASRKNIGYESLARIANQQGTVMSGNAIITASHALNIQHIVDRHLHSRSVEEFTEHSMQGKLFVNLIPGFVRKPSFYFDALTGAAYAGNIAREDIVLDITTVEQVKDTQHLEKISEQAQEAGFCVALDDLSNAKDAGRLIDLLRPEYAKLNQKLVQRFCELKDNGELKKIIAIAEEYGCILVAVGVETEAQFTALKNAGITLFQGYLFGKAELAKKF